MTTGHRIRSTHTTGILFHWPRLYDLLVRALTFGRERAYRERLANLARLVPRYEPYWTRLARCRIADQALKSP